MTDLTQAMPTTLPAQANTASSVGIFQFNNFQDAVNAADLLARSSIVPDLYRYVDSNGQQNNNAAANCLVALNMAQRTGNDPLLIMQNLYVIKGRPTWSSQYVIAAINGCGRFTALNYEIKDLGEKEVSYYSDKVKIRDFSCVAWALEKSTNARVESIPITIEMAVKEGWYTKKDSKWKTMPEQMLRYRAAAFFGRTYVPDILMGIYPKDEVEDFIDVTPEPVAQSTTEQIPCYDTNPLLDEIKVMQTLEQCTEIGAKIKGLSEDPSVNLCGDDLPKLRKAWKAKKAEITAQIEQAQQVETTEPTTEPNAEAPTQAEPVDEKPESKLDVPAKLISNLTKAINTVTRANAGETRQALNDSKEIIGETMFNKLEEILDDRLQVMEEQAQQAETNEETA